MRHIKPICAQTKALDWGLNSGLGSFTTLVQAIISLLNAIGLLKGTSSGTSNS